MDQLGLAFLAATGTEPGFKSMKIRLGLSKTRTKIHTNKKGQVRDSGWSLRDND